MRRMIPPRLNGETALLWCASAIVQLVGVLLFLQRTAILIVVLALAIAATIAFVALPYFGAKTEKPKRRASEAVKKLFYRKRKVRAFALASLRQKQIKK